MKITNRRATKHTATMSTNRGAGFLLLVALSTLTLASCSTPQPLRGGKAMTTQGPGGDIEQSLAQGDNPGQPSRQNRESISLRTYTVPAGSRIEQTVSSTTPSLQHSNVPPFFVTLASAMPVLEREEVRANTELGASQKDTARELGAKLSSLRSITWVGLGLFVLALASLVWPPLKAVIGSVTTSVAILLGGLALMILPTLIVGNELLILGGVALTAGAWFLAHRHGQLRGQLESYSGRSTPAANTKASSARPDNL